MKFSYLVRHDGIDYPIGTEVPIGEVKVEETVNVEQEIQQPSFEYTKSQINRMSTSELQGLAEMYGLDSDKTGAELKKILIAKFEL